MRLYLDTSVFGGYFEPEFETWTKRLFERVMSGDHIVLYSSLAKLELIGAPPRARELAEGLPIGLVEAVELTDEARRLALEYVHEGCWRDKSSRLPAYRHGHAGAR